MSDFWQANHGEENVGQGRASEEVLLCKVEQALQLIELLQDTSSGKPQLGHDFYGSARVISYVLEACFAGLICLTGGTKRC